MSTIAGNIVIGIFEDSVAAHQALDELHCVGFMDNDLGVIASSGGTLPHSPTESAPLAPEEKEKIVEDASKGALFGAGIGSVGALTLASLMIPGLGPMFVGGFLAMLAVGAAGGAVVGGIAGALIGLGLPEHHAREIEHALLAGCTVVNVNTDTRQDEAAAILDQHGAQHIELPTTEEVVTDKWNLTDEQLPTSHTSHLDLSPERLREHDSSLSSGGFTASGGFGGLATAHDSQQHFHLPGVKSHVAE